MISYDSYGPKNVSFVYNTAASGQILMYWCTVKHAYKMKCPGQANLLHCKCNLL